MVQPKVLVLRTAGTNCDAETVFAFESVGALAQRVHINELLNGEKHLRDYQILALPGGFSYGDDIISGRILANELRLRLGDELKRFIIDGKLMIGICNGFQILVRAGILPGVNGSDQRVISRGSDERVTRRGSPAARSFARTVGSEAAGPAMERLEFKQTVTLTHNDSGKFEDRWVYLKSSGRSVWTTGIDEVIYLPVAHGEGKFLPMDDATLKHLQNHDQVIFRYCDKNGGKPVYPQNPNNAVDDIAGIADQTGRILGLMPHPERHFLSIQHPSWTRVNSKEKFGAGAKIFANGVQYVKKNLI